MDAGSQIGEGTEGRSQEEARGGDSGSASVAISPDPSSHSVKILECTSCSGPSDLEDLHFLTRPLPEVLFVAAYLPLKSRLRVGQFSYSLYLSTF